MHCRTGDARRRCPGARYPASVLSLGIRTLGNIPRGAHTEQQPLVTSLAALGGPQTSAEPRSRVRMLVGQRTSTASMRPHEPHEVTVSWLARTMLGCGDGPIQVRRAMWRIRKCRKRGSGKRLFSTLFPTESF